VWAEKLCASDKSWYIYNQEMWLEEPMEERERRVCEPLKDYGRVVAKRGKRR